VVAGPRRRGAPATSPVSDGRHGGAKSATPAVARPVKEDRGGAAPTAGGPRGPGVTAGRHRRHRGAPTDASGGHSVGRIGGTCSGNQLDGAAAATR